MSTMADQEVIVKYDRPRRILHWIHAGSFVTLFITGLILFAPGISLAAQDSWTRLIHSAAAVVFIVAPVIYFFLAPRASLEFIKDAFSWHRYDYGWLRAMPRYYFLNDGSTMPAQDTLNGGQRAWRLLTVIFAPVLVITGILLWVFITSPTSETSALAGPSPWLQWLVFFHDIAFILLGGMFLIHFYLSLFHPMFAESKRAMTRGTVTAGYVRTHSRRWYDRIVGEREKA